MAYMALSCFLTMNVTYENKRGMLGAVEAILETNRPIWEPLPAFVKAADDLSGHIETIDTLAQASNGNTTGLTADKRAARDAMTVATLEIAGAVAAYASDEENGELHAKVDYSLSDLRRVRDTEIAGVCLNIHDAAKANLAALADFGVTAKKLTELKGKIDAYSGTVSKPRTAKSNKSATSKLLVVEFGATDNVLSRRLDRLMMQFKATQPAFFSAYSTARLIVDNRASRNGSNGNGSNGHNGTPTPQP